MKSNQGHTPLLSALMEYAHSNPVAFDVPGHKLGKGILPEFRDYIGENVLKLDINSMKELDNLSNPVGVIKEAEELAAELFYSDNAFFIVNGSTAGVQNMILSACNPGEKLILPRNIHKSAINGLVLSGVNPVYIQPEIDPLIGISHGVSIEDTIKTIDENLDAKAILLLSPTYYGFSINIDTIIDYAHQKNMIVLVDESHGTHFYFNEDFGKPSMKYGADMATISVHKTGGSFTQSSLLLHNEGRISKHKVRSVINIMQTSSASYLLMASLDAARYNLANNPSLMQTVSNLSDYAIEQLSNIPNISVVKKEHMYNHEQYHHDKSKLLIDVSQLGITGFEVYDLLKKDFNIQLEVGETLVVLAIISIGDSKASIEALVKAMAALSTRFAGNAPLKNEVVILPLPVIKTTPRDAFFTQSNFVPIHKAVNRISADQIMVYPPGIPLVIPGEVITEEVIQHYLNLIQYGNQVVGSFQNGEIFLKVLKEDENE